MENNQNMLKEKLGMFEIQKGMENNQILLLEKHGVLQILKEAVKIPYKCPKFIFLSFLTSLPLIFTMVFHEMILQKSMIETKSIVRSSTTDYYYYDYYYFTAFNTDFGTIIMLFNDMYRRVFLLGFLYLVPLHLLDLLNTIVTVHSASTIYAGNHLRLKETLVIPFNKTSFTGPLITSIYVLFLNSFILLGLIWAVINSILPTLGTFFMILYGAGSILLIVKWMDWSAVWNMSIVFSVLDDKHGVEAFEASGYFSRGNKKRGFQLMLLFFVWRIVLRLSCVYVGGHEKWIGLVATSFMSCVANVMKWVVCVVYFYDCKKRVLEKKVDVEEGREVKHASTGATESNDVMK